MFINLIFPFFLSILCSFFLLFLLLFCPARINIVFILSFALDCCSPLCSHFSSFYTCNQIIPPTPFSTYLLFSSSYAAVHDLLITFLSSFFLSFLIFPYSTSTVMSFPLCLLPFLLPLPCPSPCHLPSSLLPQHPHSPQPPPHLFTLSPSASAPHPPLHLSRFHLLAGAGVLLQRNKSQLNPLSLSRCSNELRSAMAARSHTAAISLTLNDSY